MTTKSRTRLPATTVLFWGWFFATLIPGGYLMASHLVPMPNTVAGSTEPARDAALAGLRTGDDDTWLAAHVLLVTCGCSGRIIDHLVARGPQPDIQEHVLLIDGGDVAGAQSLALPLRKRGYRVQILSSETLAARFRMDAAPLLIALSPDNRVVYAGGYTDRKQSPAIHDVEILQDAMAAHAPNVLPLFGCAVSQALRRTMDPLGLKNLIGG